MANILICVGTGGVGKTSVAAAAALWRASRGEKCLVLTIDPARRLKTALSLGENTGPQRVPLEGSEIRGELWAEALDVKTTLDQSVTANARPDRAEEILRHPIYQILVDSLAGMQELMAVERLHQILEKGFESVVIDTAPARHGFEFLDKPEFFVNLVSLPMVRLVGRTYRLWEESPLSRLSRRSLELYSRIESLLGTHLVRQVLDFYSVFYAIAEGYAGRAERTVGLLRKKGRTAFWIVTTASKAHRDAGFYREELRQRRFPVGALVVNRFWEPVQGRLPPEAPPLLREAVDWYQGVSQAHQKWWNEILREHEGSIPRLIRIPELPRDVDGLPALLEIAARLGD